MRQRDHRRTPDLLARRAALLLGLLASVAPAAGPATRPAKTPPALAKHYGFGPMEVLKFNWAIGEPICVDVNRDGLTDIVLANNAQARIELLLQKKDFTPDEDAARTAAADDAEDVNELRTRERNWRFKRVGFDLDVKAEHLLVADVNHDGSPDLVYYAPNGLYVALQAPPKKAVRPRGKGPGKEKDKPAATGPVEPAWMPAKKIDITDALGGRALAAGDLDGDGRTDLAVLTRKGTHVVLQKPDGALGRPVMYRSGGEKLREVHVADLNGDGRGDLVVLTGQQELPLRVRLGTADGKLGPEMRYAMPSPSVFGIARWPKVGRDLLLSVSAHSGRVRVSALGRDPAGEELPVQIYPLPGTGGAENRDVVAADVNGDGLLDLVATDPGRSEFLLYLADAKTSLTAPKRFPGLMAMRKLRAADLDGSGRAGIVALSVKEKIIGLSRFEKRRLTFPESVGVTGDPLEMELADLDGDGRADLLYVSKDKKLDKYVLRTVLRVGRPQAAPGPETVLAALEDKPSGLRAADVDGDGRVDVMVLRPYGPILLARQEPPGAGGKLRFKEVTRKDIHSGLVAEVDARSLSIGPLGKNGAPAVLLAQRRFARALTFDPKKGWTVIDQYQPAGAESDLAAAGAFRLPGRKAPTIVTYDAAGKRLALLDRKPDGTFGVTRQIAIGPLTARRIFAGDFGGPAKTSIVLGGTHRIVSVSLGVRGRAIRKLCAYESPDRKKFGPFTRLAVGDLNHDGLPELVLAESTRNHVQVLAFDPASKLVDAMSFKVFEQHRQVERARFGGDAEGSQPRAIALADVTGDAKTDLILLVHDRIIVYPQDGGDGTNKKKSDAR